MRSERTIILGSTGFIGKALLEQLIQGPHILEGYDSSTLDLRSPDSVEKLAQLLDPQTNLIIAARSRNKVDAFISFSEDIAIVSNISAALQKTCIKKCIYFSSTSVYGTSKTNLSITEETPPDADSFYGLSKLTGEAMLKLATETAKIPLLILRPCLVYGPGDTGFPYGPDRLIESMIREGKAYLFGEGEERRNYLYIDDLARLVSELIQQNVIGIYNLSSSETYSFQELVGWLRVVFKEPFEVIRQVQSRTPTDTHVVSKKLCDLFPEFSFTSIEKGLRKSIDFFKHKLAGEISCGRN